MQKVNTFIFTPIREDLVERALETLYRHTPHNFYVYVVDQTLNGLPQELIDKYIHMYLRPRRNLGFAKANNEGIKLVETEYFTMCNDDVEFINRDWWRGTLAAFDRVDAATPERPCCMVNPGSVKLPDWSVNRPKGDDFYILPYKENYTDAEYQHLLNDALPVNEQLTLMPNSVIDGVTLYCSVFKTKMFLDVGLLDEHFYPGSGEDYDWNCRANMRGYRSVGTTMSWVFHHWSKSLDDANGELKELLIDPTLSWNRTDLKWGPGFDVWGMKCDICGEHKITFDNITAVCKGHPDQITQMPQNTDIPL